MTVESSRFLLVKISNDVSPSPTFNNLGAQSDGRIGMNAVRRYLEQDHLELAHGPRGPAGVRGRRERVRRLARHQRPRQVDHQCDRRLRLRDRAVYNSLADNFQATVQATSLEINGANNSAT